MIRLSTLIWLALAAAAGIGLFQVKYKVQSLEGDLGQINRQIVRDQEAIHVLAAEWSLLNEPARLGDLARRHLELAPFTATQLARLSDLPDRPAPLPPPPDALGRPAPLSGPAVAATIAALPQPDAADDAAPAPAAAPAAAPVAARAAAPAAAPARRAAPVVAQAASDSGSDADVAAILASMRAKQ
jgi:hypothetical protein